MTPTNPSAPLATRTLYDANRQDALSFADRRFDEGYSVVTIKRTHPTGKWSASYDAEATP